MELMDPSPSFAQREPFNKCGCLVCCWHGISSHVLRKCHSHTRKDYLSSGNMAFGKTGNDSSSVKQHFRYVQIYNDKELLERLRYQTVLWFTF